MKESETIHVVTQTEGENSTKTWRKVTGFPRNAFKSSRRFCLGHLSGINERRGEENYAE